MEMKRTTNHAHEEDAMRRLNVLGMFAAVVLLVLPVSAAHAMTVAQTREFRFSLGTVGPDSFGYITFSGFGAAESPFDPFDDMGGNLILDEVQLSLEMFIIGFLFVDGTDSGDPIHLEFAGRADAGSLSVLLDFADGYVGTPISSISIDESDTGTATTISEADFVSFRDDGPILADLFASISVGYPDGVSGGTSSPLSASGSVTLTYSSTLIPEPNSVLLFSVGMLVVGRALRRRAA